MVYGKYGRMGVYPFQDAMKLVLNSHNNNNNNKNNEKNENNSDNKKDEDNTLQLRLARRWFSKLSTSSISPLKYNPRFKSSDSQYDDSEFYDTYLHARDRAYTVPEIVEWIGGVNTSQVRLVEFFPSAIYEPKVFIYLRIYLRIYLLYSSISGLLVLTLAIPLLLVYPPYNIERYRWIRTREKQQ